MSPSPSPDFKAYYQNYFAQRCRGYVNFLNDTLKRALLNGHKNSSDNGGTWDMSTRMFPAMAAWLDNPSFPTQLKTCGTTLYMEESI